MNRFQILKDEKFPELSAGQMARNRKIITSNDILRLRKIDSMIYELEKEKCMIKGIKHE